MTLASLKLKALVDVAQYKVNMPLTKPGNVAAYYRAIANDHDNAERPIALNNDAINAIVQTVEGNDDDAEQKRIALILKADGQSTDEPAEPEATDEQSSEADAGEGDDNAEPADATQTAEPDRPVEQANAVRREAEALIADYAKSTEFNAALTAGIRADREGKQSSINVLHSMRKLGMEKMDAMPLPGTKAKDPMLGNRTPDKRRTMVKNKSGNWREKYISSVDAMFDASPEGQTAHTVMRLINEAETPGKKNDWSKRSAQDKQQAYQDAKADVTAGRGILRKALSLHHMLRECEGLPDVEVYYRTAPLDIADPKKGDKPRSTRYPIVVKNKIGSGTKEEEVNYYSVTQFLGLEPADARDPAKLKENNGSVWQTLCASGGRGPATPENQVTHITTREQGEGYLSEIAAWVKLRETGTQLERWIADKDKQAGMGLLMNIDTIVSELTTIRDAHMKDIAVEHARLNAAEQADKAGKAAKAA